MTRRWVIGVASIALVLGAVVVPSAAVSAAEPRDDDSGIVVGVEIAPRDGCVRGCEIAPTTGPDDGWELADTGADIAPTVAITLGLGASGLTIAAVAGATRGRISRPEN